MPPQVVCVLLTLKQVVLGEVEQYGDLTPVAPQAVRVTLSLLQLVDVLVELKYVVLGCTEQYGDLTLVAQYAVPQVWLVQFVPFGEALLTLKSVLLGETEQYGLLTPVQL